MRGNTCSLRTLRTLACRTGCRVRCMCRNRSLLTVTLLPLNQGKENDSTGNDCQNDPNCSFFHAYSFKYGQCLCVCVCLGFVSDSLVVSPGSFFSSGACSASSPPASRAAFCKPCNSSGESLGRRRIRLTRSQIASGLSSKRHAGIPVSRIPLLM